jgi:hypothetical protein
MRVVEAPLPISTNDHFANEASCLQLTSLDSYGNAVQRTDACFH